MALHATLETLEAMCSSASDVKFPADEYELQYLKMAGYIDCRCRYKKSYVHVSIMHHTGFRFCGGYIKANKSNLPTATLLREYPKTVASRTDYL